jgi:hypothetical protein
MKINAEILEFAGYTEVQIDRYFNLLDRKIRHGLSALSVNDRRFYNKCRVDADAANKKLEAQLVAARKVKISGKRPVETKEHYRWVSCYLNTLREVVDVTVGEVSALVIILEEELRALSKYQPVLDQVDTSKRSKFRQPKKDLLDLAAAVGRVAYLDEVEVHERTKQEFAEIWKDKWDESFAAKGLGWGKNAIIPDSFELEFREIVRAEMETLTREVFPSVEV